MYKCSSGPCCYRPLAVLSIGLGMNCRSYWGWTPLIGYPRSGLHTHTGQRDSGFLSFPGCCLSSAQVYEPSSGIGPTSVSSLSSIPSRKRSWVKVLSTQILHYISQPSFRVSSILSTGRLIRWPYAPALWNFKWDVSLCKPLGSPSIITLNFISQKTL